MATQRDGGLVARSVREALGTLVSPQLYQQLLDRALRSAGLSEIPERGARVGTWIQGDLLREIESTVGADAAELVADQLRPIIAHAGSQSGPPPRPGIATQPPEDTRARRSARAERPQPGAFASEPPTGVLGTPEAKSRHYGATARVKLSPEQLELLHSDADDTGNTTRPQAPEGDTQLPRVLVASTARGEVDAIRRYLEGNASVATVGDLVGLLDALDEPGMREPIVLIDCQRPTVHVTSVAAIGEDLPQGTTVVLWGASEDSWRELEGTPSSSWVRCSHEATPGDVGSLCSMLILQRSVANR